MRRFFSDWNSGTQSLFDNLLTRNLGILVLSFGIFKAFASMFPGTVVPHVIVFVYILSIWASGWSERKLAEAEDA